MNEHQITIYDALTGLTITRPMTQEEIAEVEANEYVEGIPPIEE